MIDLSRRQFAANLANADFACPVACQIVQYSWPIAMTALQMAPLPVCKAILLCDRIVVDELGKLSLLGVFNNFYVDDDLIGRDAEAFCQVTDALGRYSIVAEVHDLFASEILARSSSTEVEIDDLLMTTNIIISMPRLKFFHIELHDLVIFANGQEIDRRPFGVAVMGSDAHVRTD